MLKKEWILYEDKDILVVYKPAGIAVQNARTSQMDLEHMLLNYLAEQTQGSRQIPYLGIIHRLDQPVEGILVFARTPAAAAELTRQMQSGKMDKRYLAVTEGGGSGRTGSQAGGAFLSCIEQRRWGGPGGDSSEDWKAPSDPRTDGSCGDTSCGRQKIRCGKYRCTALPLCI